MTNVIYKSMIDKIISSNRLRLNFNPFKNEIRFTSMVSSIVNDLVDMVIISMTRDDNHIQIVEDFLSYYVELYEEEVIKEEYEYAHILYTAFLEFEEKLKNDLEDRINV
jgi:uncharacterized protein YbcV (DUF1398 family)